MATDEDLTTMANPGLPSAFGKYQIKSVLGQGAMGVVYSGYDFAMKREVAIKTVHEEILRQRRSEIIERFAAEAEAAGRLIHSNIVAVYEFNQEDTEKPFIVMEYVNGHSLKQLLDSNRRFGTDEVVRILEQLLDAIGFSHSKGIVHRDIKPSNIIITDEGKIKIMDFGIAHRDTSDLTQMGDVMGTLGYMSPEQMQGQVIDNRTDIFSVGVILFELLTGEKPFPGNSFQRVMYSTLQHTPDPPSVLNNHVSGELDAVVAKALAKIPEERFSSAEKFSLALRGALETPPAPIEKPPSGDKRFSIGVGVLALLMLVGGGIYFFKTPSKLPDPTPRTEPIPATTETGTVQVGSEPQGAVVLLDDGRYVGITPTDVSLAPGEYRLVVKKDGYYESEASIEVESEAEIPIHLILREK